MVARRKAQPMINAVIYARYSTDLQSASSIEDQVRICTAYAERQGWRVAKVYSDSAQSGASLMRKGIQGLLSDARAGCFEVVLSEALDRLSRDQADLANIFKRLNFDDVKMFTIADHEISEMHIGLKGTMGSLYLKDLRQKTHRGLEGRVLKGKSAGGNSYGYSVIRSIGADGNPVTGDRAINEAEADVVRRIFREYIKGKSPKRIASDLNRDGIACPSGGAWGASTIYGNRKRGTGILNNELYVGRLVWNRLRYVKDPLTGKRVSKQNDADSLRVTDVQHLRIIDQDTWESAKAYQGTLDARPSLQTKQRPTHLFSFMLKCGECGGGMSIVGKGRYGCSTARNKGTCQCRTTISQADLEEKVLTGIRSRLMTPALAKAFCEEYTAQMNRLRTEQNAASEKNKRDLARIGKEMEVVYQAFIKSPDFDFLREKLSALDARKKELQAAIENTPPPTPVYVHPQMSLRYAEAIEGFLTAVNDPEHRSEAAKNLRTILEKIVLTPNLDRTELVVDIVGELSGILHIAEGHRKGKGAVHVDGGSETQQGKGIEQVEALVASSVIGSQSAFQASKDKMVAGAGFEPAAFRL
jgi:site-specific DNA recombinase